MPTRTLVVIVALGSIAIAAPIAQGAPNKHQIKLTIKDATIASQGDRPGNTQTTAGLVSGKPFGHGVELITDNVTTVTSTTITFAGTITIYTTHGTINGTIKIKPASSGGATGTGTGKITGDTGSYTGAHGTFTFTGAEPSLQTRQCSCPMSPAPPPTDRPRANPRKRAHPAPGKILPARNNRSGQPDHQHVRHPTRAALPTDAP